MGPNQEGWRVAGKVVVRASTHAGRRRNVTAPLHTQRKHAHTHARRTTQTLTMRCVQVRPFPEQNLSGWRIRNMSFGNESFGICADANKEDRRPWVEGCTSVPHVIMWGNAKYGELGFGAGKKSSAQPDVVKTLKNVACKSVSVRCGWWRGGAL